MSDDVLTRARAVVAQLAVAEGKATPGPFRVWSEPGDLGAHASYLTGCLRGDGLDLSMVWVYDDERPGNHLAVAVTGDGPASASNAAAIVALRNAAPALLALAGACAALADGYQGAPWWEADAAGAYCIGCGVGASRAVRGQREGVFDHAADCPALAIDAALADLAAQDGGEVAE